MTTKRKPPGTPWKPGQSGNPAGRPKGSKSPSTKLREMIDVKPILEALQAAAEGGDVQAARTLLERSLPVCRASAAPVVLPELDAAATLTDKARAVLAAVGRGDIAPDLGASLVTAIGNVAKVAEVDELARRITELEKTHEKH